MAIKCKYAAHSQFAASRVNQVQVTSYVRDERDSSKKFKYEMLVEWSDDSRFELYRLYSDFYEFQSELEAIFPVQAGQISEKERILPSLPSKRSGLFRSSLTPTEMRDKMQEYLDQLLSLDEFIIRSSVVCSFFKPRDEFDHKLRGKGKNPSMHPLAAPGGLRIEEFVAISDFSPNKSNQLSFKRGQVLNVLVREGGWWFCESEGKSGWAPSTFLSPLEDTEVGQTAGGVLQPLSERSEGKYRAMATFMGEEGQHSCQPGDLFLVVERDPDGWWLALKLGMESEGELTEAWIPAAYLESLDDDSYEESSDESERFLVTERYSARKEDELTLEEGTYIEVLKKNQDGWWFVKQGEMSGFFPAYNIQPAPEPHPPVISLDSTTSNPTRNVAASKTVFNKVRDFGLSTRRDKRTTVRYPPPRLSAILTQDSSSTLRFSIRRSICSTSTPVEEGISFFPQINIEDSHSNSLKGDLQVANPAPVLEVPACPVDETEVKNVKSKAKETALLRKKDSHRNVQLLVKQVEQTKRALTSGLDTIIDSDNSKGDPMVGYEGMLRKQNLKIDGLQEQVSDLNLAVIQMTSRMDRLEDILGIISKKLDPNSSS